MSKFSSNCCLYSCKVSSLYYLYICDDLNSFLDINYSFMIIILVFIVFHSRKAKLSIFLSLF